MVHIPQQNNVVECHKRTLIEHAQLMAIASNCASFLLSELVNIANTLVYFRLTSTNSRITPNQLYYKILPHVNHLRLLESLCYLHVPKESNPSYKVRPNAILLIGYNMYNKAYCLFEPTKQ